MRIGADRPGAWVCKVSLDGVEVNQCFFAGEEARKPGSPYQAPFSTASDGHGGIYIALGDGRSVPLEHKDATALRDSLTAALRAARKESA